MKLGKKSVFFLPWSDWEASSRRAAPEPAAPPAEKADAEDQENAGTARSASRRRRTPGCRSPNRSKCSSTSSCVNRGGAPRRNQGAGSFDHTFHSMPSISIFRTLGGARGEADLRKEAREYPCVYLVMDGDLGHAWVRHKRECRGLCRPGARYQ